MDNDNKIDTFDDSKQESKEVSLFLQEELIPLKKKKTLTTYNLEKEYAKTKKNRNYSIWIIMAITVAAVVLATWLTISGLSAKNNKLQVSLESFEDLNLRNLFDALSKTQDLYEKAAKAKAELEASLESRLTQAKRNKDVDFANLSKMKLARKQRLEKEAEIIKRYNSIVFQAHEDLDEKLKAAELELKQYEELSSDKYLTMWASAIYGVYGSSGEISTWKQKGREWSNIRIGNTSKTIGDVGCLVTSVSILIKKSGVPTKDIYPFNPGTFVTALNNVYGFDGANLQYGPISKVVPGFVYQDRVMLKGKTKSEKLALIRRYQESGYYLAAEVAGATETSQHWVAIDNVVGDKIYMLDPGSEATDMWQQYDWNLTTQFVYFKATK